MTPRAVKTPKTPKAGSSSSSSQSAAFILKTPKGGKNSQWLSALKDASRKVKPVRDRDELDDLETECLSEIQEAIMEKPGCLRDALLNAKGVEWTKQEKEMVSNLDYHN